MKEDYKRLFAEIRNIETELVRRLNKELGATLVWGSGHGGFDNLPRDKVGLIRTVIVAVPNRAVKKAAELVCDIPRELYEEYRNELQKSVVDYRGGVVGARSAIPPLWLVPKGQGTIQPPEYRARRIVQGIRIARSGGQIAREKAVDIAHAIFRYAQSEIIYEYTREMRYFTSEDILEDMKRSRDKKLAALEKRFSIAIKRIEEIAKNPKAIFSTYRISGISFVVTIKTNKKENDFRRSIPNISLVPCEDEFFIEKTTITRKIPKKIETLFAGGGRWIGVRIEDK